MRLVVTGAAGFVGSHLVDQLLADGHEVLGVDLKPAGRPCRERLRWAATDFRDPRSASALVEGADGVIHLAAVSRLRTAREAPLRCADLNVTGTLVLLEAVRTSRARPWFLLASTREVVNCMHFGVEQELSLTPEQGLPTGPGARKRKTLYGISKLAGELLCELYVQEHGLSACVLRFSDVYGSERDHPGKLLPTLVHRALLGKPVELHDKDQPFDLVHYRDIVRGIGRSAGWLALAGPSHFELFHLSSGMLTTLEELWLRIQQLTGSRSAVRSRESGAPRSVLQVPDRGRTQELLGFEPEVPLEEGLASLVELHARRMDLPWQPSAPPLLSH